MSVLSTTLTNNRPYTGATENVNPVISVLPDLVEEEKGVKRAQGVKSNTDQENRTFSKQDSYKCPVNETHTPTPTTARSMTPLLAPVLVISGREHPSGPPLTPRSFDCLLPVRLNIHITLHYFCKFSSFDSSLSLVLTNQGLRRDSFDQVLEPYVTGRSL